MSIKSLRIKNAFTLIELLLVMGILGVLAVLALLALNPAESQRKSRDAKRIRDAGTYTSILEQIVTDKKPFTKVDTTLSTGGTNLTQQRCNNNFTETDVCEYANSVPLDPFNNKEVFTLNGGGTQANPTTDKYTVFYLLRLNSDGTYEVDTFMESKSNWDKIVNDSGSNPLYFETGTNLTAF